MTDLFFFLLLLLGIMYCLDGGSPVSLWLESKERKKTLMFLMQLDALRFAVPKSQTFVSANLKLKGF